MLMLSHVLNLCNCSPSCNILPLGLLSFAAYEVILGSNICGKGSLYEADTASRIVCMARENICNQYQIGKCLYVSERDRGWAVE
jgi:hypothetical protein